MSQDNKNSEPKPETKIPGEAAPGSDELQASSLEQATEVEVLKGQLADLTDRLLRAHAEMDNMRKRGEREREDIAKYAISKFARDVVSVGDNLQRAIGAVPAGAAAGAAEIRETRSTKLREFCGAKGKSSRASSPTLG